MKTTPLHASHLSLHAKMAEFAGYDMPIQYQDGIIAEHNWTRTHAGLFDVSHMGQVLVEGPGAAAFWDYVTPSYISRLKDNVAKYTVLTNEHGGIIDDLIVTCLGPDRFLAVINAGCKDKDLGWLRQNLPQDATLTHLEDRALLALQGPDAKTALRDTLNIDAANLGYMRFMAQDDIWISRLGYTGEDGFEISIPARKAAAIWDQLLQHTSVKPVGLAARDSLRLDMGYPLYGHDLNDRITPVEADLAWIIGKDKTGYIGDGVIGAQIAAGTPPRLRAGFMLTDKGIAREGAEIYTKDGQKLGDVTSGGFSPGLNKAIGQGYIDPTLAKTGDEVRVRVRGRDIAGVLLAMPFTPARTKKN